MDSDRELDDAGALGPRDLGKYRLLAAIGRGGMGEVYLAMACGPAGFRKLVVLKCMNAASAEDEQLRRMFLDEAMLAARLSHHNVVQTYEAGELQGTPYIAMEYLDGQPVSRLAQVVPDMNPRMAAHVISEALAGLHYAHQLKDFDGTPLAIVHRDLSPPNIFVTYDGVVKVVDFGIAKTSLASRTKTDTGMFKGKISYMAPEQAMNEEIDHRADIFSVGAVLWELLAGRRLFREISPALTLKRLLQDEIPPLSSVKPDIDPALDIIVTRALQRSPEARYASALQMRHDLERYVRAGEPVNWDAELAALVSERFAKQRQKVQRQVQLCVSQESELSGRLPKVNLTDTGAGAGGSRSLSRSADWQTPPGAVSMEISSSGRPLGVEHADEEQPRARESRRLRIGVLAAALCGSLAMAGLIVFSSELEASPQSASAAATSHATAAVEVLSTPPGALIFVDGEPSGLATPAVLKGLKAGRSVTLRLDKAGFQALEERVELAGGQTLSRSFRLLESDGLVRFVGAPVDARVYVDDVAVAYDLTQAINVPVGSHKLRLETPSALVFSQVVEVVPGEQTIQVASARSTK